MAKSNKYVVHQDFNLDELAKSTLSYLQKEERLTTPGFNNKKAALPPFFSDILLKNCECNFLAYEKEQRNVYLTSSALFLTRDEYKYQVNCKPPVRCERGHGDFCGRSVRLASHFCTVGFFKLVFVYWLLPFAEFVDFSVLQIEVV